MNSKIIWDSEEANILTVNSTDLFTILSEDEIFGFLNYRWCIKFPEDVEVVKEVILDIREEKQKSKILQMFKKDKLDKFK